MMTIDVVKLAYYLRNRKCERMDARLLNDPFPIPSLTWNELSEDMKQEYINVALDVVAFLKQD